MTATATLQADEKLALDLMGAIRAAAEELCAPSAVDLVSVTVDVSARIEDAGAATFETRIDRRTRTVLFTGGMARQNGAPVMKATAVYRILPAG